MLNESNKRQAKIELESICDMVERLDDDNEEVSNLVLEEIMVRPLCVQVRSGWYDPCDEIVVPVQYKIELCYGGPSVKITGELNAEGEPETVGLVYQGWDTRWEDYPLDYKAKKSLLRFAKHFNFTK